MPTTWNTNEKLNLDLERKDAWPWGEEMGDLYGGQRGSKALWEHGQEWRAHAQDLEDDVVEACKLEDRQLWVRWGVVHER